MCGDRKESRESEINPHTLASQETARLAVGGREKVFWTEGTAYSRWGRERVNVRCIQSGPVLLKWAARKDNISRDGFGKAARGGGIKDQESCQGLWTLSKTLASLKGCEHDHIPTLPPGSLASLGSLTKHLWLILIYGTFLFLKWVGIWSAHMHGNNFCPGTQPWSRPWELQSGGRKVALPTPPTFHSREEPPHEIETWIKHVSEI